MYYHTCAVLPKTICEISRDTEPKRICKLTFSLAFPSRIFHLTSR